MIVGVAAIDGVVVAGSTVVLLRAYGSEPAVTYVLGAIHATTFAILYYTLRIVFLANNQDAVHQVRGDLGETNTRDELKRAKRRRLIWGWVDSITVADGDIDHLVITRRGGIVAIDSKWRNDVHGGDISRAATAAGRAARRGTSVLRHLGYFKREQTARRRSTEPAITVTPVVALWGPIQHEVPTDACIDGIDFISGRHLTPWLRARRLDPIHRADAKQLLRELEEFQRKHRDAATPTTTEAARRF